MRAMQAVTSSMLEDHEKNIQLAIDKLLSEGHVIERVSLLPIYGQDLISIIYYEDATIQQVPKSVVLPIDPSVPKG